MIWALKNHFHLELQTEAQARTGRGMRMGSMAVRIDQEAGTYIWNQKGMDSWSQAWFMG